MQIEDYRTKACETPWENDMCRNIKTLFSFDPPATT
ncbi:MAG TPA: hypothetical protein DDW24_13760, partial [Blastocatellia bacterium]|nr:hypothetical protein [Blastocatellia bacterium]